MDIVTLSAAAVALALPFLGKVSDSVAGSLGEKAVNGGREMLGWLRSRARGDAAIALTKLEAEPELPANRTALEAALVRQLETSAQDVIEVKAILQKSETSVHIDNRGGLFIQGEATGVVGSNASNVSVTVTR